ncbi:CCA tRNA nucleotidyltransferase mitochondrial [Brachionus plicatilis]|uniref:CCA tRNA nucleotidyltransferase mitochondrial n=1 Tax=Brachionus plicatilis TaxID=10195 RepID=A0A3M7RI79_BRAPC|nr:CCA tRNA nucleotidyltransferase mitochondrial [Brachionus plicatilis]
MTEKLDSLEFKSIWNDELNYLFDLFERNDFKIRIAGGAVRDLLMGSKPHDIDLATTATPDQMKEIFDKENIRMLHTNGEKHGTITVRLNDKENYEITTLRIDVLTDGRHAEVQFTEDWRLDANRRDLTINSIFLDRDGSIIDFFGGYEDIKNHRIKFVGQPSTRIQEDYLRILRYFRFYPRICLDENSHCSQSIEAIKANATGLKGIAGERIWVEFRKIVCSKFADSLMKQIVDTQVHKYIGLPDSCNLNEFSTIYRNFEKNLIDIPSPITMVCSLLHSAKEFEKLHKRMKFSNEEKRIAEFLFAYRDQCKRNLDQENGTKLEDKLKPFKFILVDNVKDGKAFEKLTELLKYVNRLEYIEHLRDWQVPIFPITGDILENLKIPKGPIYSKILFSLKESWKNEFNLDTSEETVERLKEMMDEFI